MTPRIFHYDLSIMTHTFYNKYKKNSVKMLHFFTEKVRGKKDNKKKVSEPGKPGSETFKSFRLFRFPLSGRSSIKGLFFLSYSLYHRIVGKSTETPLF